MVGKVVDYVKTHKLAVFLLAVVLYFLFRGTLSNSMMYQTMETPKSDYSREGGINTIVAPLAYSDIAVEESVPASDSAERKVVTNSNFSLLVKNVTDSITKIKAKVDLVSGYVINTNISRGETFESATLTLRVPSNAVEDVTSYLRSISVKVVSENVSGNDITDQYVDIEGRLAELQNVKAKLEQIMNEAKTSDEMLRVFNQVNSINSQIESYKGKLKYMDKSSSTSRLTVVLSTDELSLPYAPAEPWRPEVVFKSAVRSLLGTLQSIGTLIIWAAVYIPFFLVLLLIVLIVKKKRSKSILK